MDRVKRSGKASPLLVAVGPKDKENLGNSDVLLKCKSTSGSLKRKTQLKHSGKFNNKNMEMLKNQLNNIQSEFGTDKEKITAEDLTTNGNPGERFWEHLSESRRVVLEITKKENMELHSKIMELEYENTKLKAMLAEAKTSIHLLTELLGENESDCEEESVDDTSHAPDEVDSEADDSLIDASFTSV